MTQRSYREARDLCEEVGLTILSVETAKHIKVRVAAPDGRTRLFVFPLTPSDRRGLDNARAGLRRFARGGAIR